MTTSAIEPAQKGGAWLISPEPASVPFTPEQLSDEHRLIAQTTAEFVSNEVLPGLARLERKEWDFARQLVRRCGELGLLGVDVPETYGGVDLDKVASVVVAEQITVSASFGATFGAQGNLTIIPILCFGTEAQKRTYLPGLVSGDLVGAYALSESGSGSDALSAKTRAVRLPDGSFVLTGEKMWITNGGFADVFIVFAKIDGEQFSAFIVERGFPGVSTGQEEQKLGLHGSSTTPLILQDAKVPADNLLGDIGKGHNVAFNVLNYGRFKLGAMTGGGAKAAIGEAARYAAERRQFGRPIGSFGAIKHKLGEMTAHSYAVESMLYRVAGAIDAMVAEGSDAHESSSTLAALEEFAVEASILKVAGSEMLDYVLDENIQIHGGNGYVKDYPAERHYRDARVNRIFEGTNEINRLLISGMLVRRALKGQLALIPAAKRQQDDLLSPSVDALPDGPLAEQRRIVDSLKKMALMVLGTAMHTYGDKLSEEQEVLSAGADIVINAFAAESAVRRARWIQEQGRPMAELHRDAASVVADVAAARSEMAARQALAAMAEGDQLRTLLGALRRLAKGVPTNAVAARRRLADETLSRAGYIFEG